MKALLILLSLFCLVLAGSALAGGGGTTPNDPDLIGLYVDEGGLEWEAEYSELPAGPVQAYVVFKNLSTPTVGGYEFKMWFEGGGMLMMAMPRGLAINAATRVNEYVIGLGEPLVAVDGDLCVMDVYFFLTEAPTEFYGYLGATYFHSLEDPYPVFINGEDPLDLRYLYNDVGMDVTDPVFHITVLEPIDTESSSWGEVKSLYR